MTFLSAEFDEGNVCPACPKISLLDKGQLCNSEWAYQRCCPCYKCDVSLQFYLYPCGFDTTLHESKNNYNGTGSLVHDKEV